MNRAAGMIALPMMLVVVAGCSHRSYDDSSRGLPSSRYEDYAGKGPFPVNGVSPRSAGPQLFQQVLQSPHLTEYLRSQKTPDTLEVIEAANGNLQILLVYSRPSNPPGRRIAIERVGDRLTAYPPTGLDGSSLGSGQPSQVAPRVEKEMDARAASYPPDAEIPKPTEIQMLECPIDPERADCLDLCPSGSPYEWCL